MTAILGFVALIAGGTVGLAFALRAAGVRYPATLACLAGAIAMGLGGPVLIACPILALPPYPPLPPTRLAIVSLLAATQWAEFKFIRDSAGLSDSALSKQLATLEQAGYAEIRKAFVGKRPRTSARLTPAGRTAFEQHVAALQDIVARAGVTITPR